LVTEPAVMALSALSFTLFDDIRCVITTDPALTKLAEEIQQGVHGHKWRIIDGQVVVDGRVYIPTDSPLAHEVIVSPWNWP
jgi:hypothetical protein